MCETGVAGSRPLQGDRLLLPLRTDGGPQFQLTVYSLRVFGQVGPTGRVLELLNSGRDA